MKWDFFYDEDDSKPYESFEDWYKDIKYLIVPTILMLVSGAAVYIYFRFFHF
ncbi:hypothetical protein [Algoriphagus sp. NG3]|uniref:hypothetical protein n=1 Tax=Algoriphagus sp. NG3 TaxID=3097546 RepID=UPI002A7F2356|nr:hypothetical protein [Algoriphagus sp. NG3]WPR75944.1 hypothetical protein SLW71_01100 [Algoriphagus sp. NG3]